ncbi:Crp/Fnr family transcriptional regulator [Bdellovibrio svalbardensis]|uniref:Crp/Fnr family transcriptional regulator n=1 Tax=Bdellovibrio svalbardensis TaxID=2972972 RepID=A0ABT6DPX3_9BACT|nr:Crp/Fnr family transcriptional regulator [Bdellovibrio svalbardensis]MDG0817188.1 Crp/Fnr family transcriptional regulator [Bdellovibrio svalbardensis]
MDAYTALKDSLAAYLPIPPDQWLQFVRYLNVRNLKADEVYYSQGQKYEEIGFVVKGLVYNFYSNDKGEEFVKNFVAEGSTVASYMSVVRELPAVYSCVAVEDTHLVTVKYSDLKKLYESHSCWERLGRLNAEECLFETEQREQQLLMMNATERYELFMKQNAALANRLPQYLIASYIGVSPVTLSRIRGK